MKKINYYTKLLFSLPRSVYFNFRVLRFKDAIKLPFIILQKTNFLELNRVVTIESPITPFMIKIGVEGTKQINGFPHSIINISKNGCLVFLGKASFAKGTSLDCSKGKLVFGKGFSSNRNCFISCDSEITFGENVLLGDNVIIRDNDGHTIYHEGYYKQNIKPIRIGNHVWIASQSKILKGAEIADESVLGFNSLLTKAFAEKNILIAGSPAKKMQENITWTEELI